VYFSTLNPFVCSSVIIRAVTAQHVIRWAAPAITTGIMNILPHNFVALKK
jgi:hypothetical protein